MANLDIREPALRQHQEAMQQGSKALLEALCREHPRQVAPIAA